MDFNIDFNFQGRVSAMNISEPHNKTHKMHHHGTVEPRSIVFQRDGEKEKWMWEND
jgi:hypothetical protein